jgi:hypothetical protein
MLNLTSLPSATLVPLKYAALVGRFSAVQASVNGCTQPTTATYSATALSVTVASSPTCGTTGTSPTTDSGLSTGAIVGIVIGCIVGGAAVAAIIIVLVMRQRKQVDSRVKSMYMGRGSEMAERK